MADSEYLDMKLEEQTKLIFSEGGKRELKLLALKLNYKTKLRRMFTFCWGVRQTNNAAEHNMKLTINLLFCSFEQKQTLRSVRSVSRIV